MARLILFAVLLVCMIFMYQASPVPQDASQPQTSPATDLEQIGDKAKEMFENVKDTVQQTFEDLKNDRTISGVMDSTKEFFQKAGETIRKEVEKIGEKLHD